MKYFLFIIFFLLLVQNHSFCQSTGDTVTGNRSALGIYLDCPDCDMDFIRTNFTAVNYVNDCKDADVHILVTSMATGSGGTAYTIILLGYGEYKRMPDTVIYNLSADATQDEARRGLLDRIRLGLVPYLLKTPYGNKLSLFIDEAPGVITEEDPWKSWIFEISGTAALSSQTSSQSLSASGSLYLSKVTPEVKIESANSFSFNENKLRLYDNDSLVYALNVTQRDIYSKSLFVKSLGNHAGIGGFAGFAKSDYSNLDHQVMLGPAIEFNLFSYDDASSKQLRFLYSISYEQSRYNKVTVYNKFTDQLFRHDLYINFVYYQPWGTLSAYARASAYINDPSQYSLGANAIAYVRIFRGLSFNISGGFAYCQDQRSLQQELVSTEDFLTGQQEMKKDFSYSMTIGLSYRFGSKNNNTVNPRFEY